MTEAQFDKLTRAIAEEANRLWDESVRRKVYRRCDMPGSVVDMERSIARSGVLLERHLIALRELLGEQHND